MQQLATPKEDGLQPDIQSALDAGTDGSCGAPHAVAFY